MTAPSQQPDRLTPRLKRAELASGLGALLLGLGLGVLAGRQIAPFGLPLLVVGIVIHGWGMFDKHRLQRRVEVVPPLWSVALYWICWVGLAVMATWLAVYLAV